MIILIVDILTAISAFVFVIYGLFRAVEERDDIIILIGITVQIGLISWLVDATSRLSGDRYAIFLLIPLAIIGMYPVFTGIMRNEIFPADLQIKLKSPVENRKEEIFVPILRPTIGVTTNECDEEWEEY